MIFLQNEEVHKSVPGGFLDREACLAYRLASAFYGQNRIKSECIKLAMYEDGRP